MISGIGREPDYTTKSGMSRYVSLNNYDGINERIVTSQFNKKHHMYQTYGITGMQVHKYDDGRNYIKIFGNIFEGQKKKDFSFFASEYTIEKGKSLYKHIEGFLKDLKKVRKMDISDDMIRVIKCIH